MMDLNGKTVLITGAGTGLGRAAAAAFAREGAQVVLCGRRLKLLEEVRQQIENAGGIALAVQADVSVETDVKRLTEAAVERFGRIDVLVNNAAVFEPGQVGETGLDAWNAQIGTNLTGAFLLIRECLPIMRKQHYGRIVNVTSSLAWNGSGGFAAYSASKAGLESLTRTTADEEEVHNILVNLFNPGTMRSGMHATGKDPAEALPELIRLASLPDHSPSGKLIAAV
jgi:3-oxoacyl-[acyl-carrier protein] reductase